MNKHDLILRRADGDGFVSLETIPHARCPGVGERDDQPAAAPVLDHLEAFGVPLRDERTEVFGVGSPEFVDVLIVVSHGNDAHRLIADHQGVDEREVVFVHVLRFVDDEHGLGNSGGLHAAVTNQRRGTGNDVLRFLQRAGAAEDVEAEAVKRSDFDIMGGGADQIDQALFEFGGGRAGEGEHQELLGADVLLHQKGGELVHEHAGLAAAGSRRDGDVLGARIDDGLLLRRQTAENALVLMLGHVEPEFLRLGPAEVAGNEGAVVEMEVVLHVAQRQVVVLHHQIGVFADDVNLLNLLLIVRVEPGVVALAELTLVVGNESDDRECVVENEKTAVEPHGADAGEIEHGILDVADRHAAFGQKMVLPGFQKTERGKGHALVFGIACG